MTVRTGESTLPRRSSPHPAATRRRPMAPLPHGLASSTATSPMGCCIHLPRRTRTQTSSLITSTVAST
ncbi:hypothetical protein CKAH01_18984 [Colletotrichum kahawae]|uniref:Uncharacterized protein n=1 Tax=Colletotrichum kahawae TaxID=34407 RepID=A0AAD9Y257_COLKA|nr:hypothetical protein CKAH01_18984 [Colletotrichum kahawae]